MSLTDSRIQALLEKNRKVAETWVFPGSVEQLRTKGKEAGGGLVILTCLDPRCVPEQYLGANLGAGVIRNAGGRATKDAITSITVLRSVANASTVLVVHHTDCGLSHVTEDGIRQDAKTRTPDAAAEIDATESYGSFDTADFEKTIMEDVATLRNAKVLAGVDIRGLAFDTVTGLLKELKEDASSANL